MKRRQATASGVWGLFFWWGILLLVLGVAAGEAKPMQAVILFDNSGSMRQTDPLRLSSKAAQLFLALAQPEDAIGLAAFSDQGSLLIPLTPRATPGIEKLFQRQLDTLLFTGQTTDLEAALEIGLSSFPVTADPSPQERIVLLLTDGKLDLGPGRRAEEPAVLARIRQELLPRYKQRGIPIYTIAFSEQADQDLLQEIARLTHGEFRYVPNASILHEAFSELFILAHHSETLPVSAEGTFRVDAGVEEASLVLSKGDPRENIRLITPEKRALDAHHPAPGVDWTATPSYDLVQLIKPAVGDWKIDRPSPGKETAIVRVSTRKLQVELLPPYLETGEPVTVRVFLSEEGKRVEERSQLQDLQVQATVITPQKETTSHHLTLQEQGVFTTTLPPFPTPGRYLLHVFATGPAFHRQRTLTFTLHPPCFLSSLFPGQKLQVTLAQTCPAFRELQLVVRRILDDGTSTQIPLNAVQPRLFQAEIPLPPPGQEGQVTLQIRGRLENGTPFTLTRGPWPLPKTPSPPEGEEISFWVLGKKVLWNLLLLNGVLVSVVGSGWILYQYYRRLRKGVHHVS